MFTRMESGLLGGFGSGYIWSGEMVSMNYGDQDTEKEKTYTATQDCIVEANYNLWNYGYNAYATIYLNNVQLKTHQNTGAGTTTNIHHKDIFSLRTGDTIKIVLKSHQTGETNMVWWVYTQFTS